MGIGTRHSGRLQRAKGTFPLSAKAGQDCNTQTYAAARRMNRELYKEEKIASSQLVGVFCSATLMQKDEQARELR